ncbi:hypothetical protein [Variovorax sp. 22077]|uniref:hypothetical protein n=1 Tax=Variovorax sp. 22077 TaxID=3453867 RepID=UPI003F84C7BA
MTASFVCELLAFVSVVVGAVVDFRLDLREFAEHGYVRRRGGAQFLSGMCAALVFLLVGSVLS